VNLGSEAAAWGGAFGAAARGGEEIEEEGGGACSWRVAKLVARQTAGVMKLTAHLLWLPPSDGHASLMTGPLHNGNIPMAAPCWAPLLPSSHP
jgi:hypothetical protein